MKIYAGAPAAARHYVEAGRCRADDYYLTVGTGIARRYSAGGGRVAELPALAGDGYEAWVAGLDPDTREPRGRLRTDDRAVRFVEVVVNGPKSWSLAAALHRDIAAAYDAAQDRAATQIIGWLGEHATTRVGPRGGQVQVPVEVLEAVTVRHHTSRAGDPHRHLHLQINARVFAAGRWRGLHTVGVRDFLAAINGIGHAAVATDPQFRSALAAHATPCTALEKYWSWPTMWGRSALGRRRSAATSTVTSGSGPPSTPARRPGRNCGGPGTGGRGLRAARTRSPPSRVPT